MRLERHGKKKRKGLKIFLIILCVLILTVIGIAAFAYWKTNSTFNDIHKPVKGRGGSSVTLGKKTPFSVLILGVDERENDRGRSDTIIAATVNGETNKIQMLSIPRDTRTEIVGHGTTEKINAAYAYGGVKMASATVSKFLNDLPFNYYIKMNMEGVKDLVDAVGGVDVYNDKDGLRVTSSEDKSQTFNKGNIHLDGASALSYIRIRKTDAEGDFGRQKRQQQLMSAVAQKALSTGIIWRFDKILTAIGKNVETDFTMADITKIAKNYRDSLKNVENLQVKGNGGKLEDGLWYYQVSSEERARLREELAKNLNIK